MEWGKYGERVIKHKNLQKKLYGFFPQTTEAGCSLWNYVYAEYNDLLFVIVKSITLISMRGRLFDENYGRRNVPDFGGKLKYSFEWYRYYWVLHHIDTSGSCVPIIKKTNPQNKYERSTLTIDLVIHLAYGLSYGKLFLKIRNRLNKNHIYNFVLKLRRRVPVYVVIIAPRCRSSVFREILKTIRLEFGRWDAPPPLDNPPPPLRRDFANFSRAKQTLSHGTKNKGDNGVGGRKIL